MRGEAQDEPLTADCSAASSLWLTLLTFDNLAPIMGIIDHTDPRSCAAWAYKDLRGLQAQKCRPTPSPLVRPIALPHILSFLAAQACLESLRYSEFALVHSFQKPVNNNRTHLAKPHALFTSASSRHLENNDLDLPLFSSLRDLSRRSRVTQIISKLQRKANNRADKTSCVAYRHWTGANRV